MKNEILHAQYQQLLDEGIAKSTKRAHVGDSKRFWEYAKKVHGLNENYPVPIDVALKFILDHVKATQDHPALKVNTLKRYLASVSSIQQTYGHGSLLANPQIKMLLKRARRALPNQQPQSKKPITAEILKKLIQTCDDSLHGVRDKAILYLGFSSGGRRRSEIVKLNIEDVQETKTGYLLTLRKSKTDQDGKGMTVPLTGSAAIALKQWLTISNIPSGSLFRGIRSNNVLNDMPFDGSSINRMVKRRVLKAKLNPPDYSAHSLRSGFLTESINQGVPLFQAMAMTGHRSVSGSARYYKSTENLAVNLIIE